MGGILSWRVGLLSRHVYRDVHPLKRRARWVA